MYNIVKNVGEELTEKERARIVRDRSSELSLAGGAIAPRRGGIGR